MQLIATKKRLLKITLEKHNPQNTLKNFLKVKKLILYMNHSSVKIYLYKIIEGFEFNI